MKTIMVTAPSSGSGKTLITIGIIRALKRRGLDISAFKTGPDFIDTRYLGLASGKRAGNLDIHMMGREGLKKALSINNGEYAVVEGAMGYFDGIYNTFVNSSYDISKELDINTILVYTPKGEMFSLIPKIKGMVDFEGSKIKGIILNKVRRDIYLILKEQIEVYTGIKVLGYIEEDRNLEIQSRYLGLIQCIENKDVEYIIEKIAVTIEKTIDIGGILNMASEIDVPTYIQPSKRDIRVAIAYDEAFSFYYNENLNLWENICHVEYFSPIRDKRVPPCDLLILGGGYPELYREELSQNKEMINSIREMAKSGGFIYGEAGGFMYLVESIEGCPMCGIFKGKAMMMDKLQRFGYVNIEIDEDSLLGNKGDILTGQEFHRSITHIENRTLFNISKPMSKRKWQCGYEYKNVFVAYPHINFLGNMKAFNHLLDKIEKERQGVYEMYIKNPMEIENKSMDIIDEVMADTNFTDREKIVVKRMIHTTGDFDYRNIITFNHDFMDKAIEGIKAGGTIFTDTKMAYMGINKKALSKSKCDLKCFIDDERAFKLSQELETTRSACTVELAVEEGIDMFVIGNAPTALFRLLELVEKGKVKPKFIIGVPVGFVGAGESKEHLRGFNIPSISTVGTKGGSNVAASIINALLYMVVGR